MRHEMEIKRLKARIKRLKARNADLADMLKTSQDAREALGKRLRKYDERIALERQRHSDAQKRIMVLEGTQTQLVAVNAKLHRQIAGLKRKVRR